jgi:hypothetical protein
MPYQEDLNRFLSQNPDDSYLPNVGSKPDPLAQGGADPGTQAPAPAYAGLTGDPYQTAIVTSAQLTALRPRRPRPVAPQPPQPFSGLSRYLGA